MNSCLPSLKGCWELGNRKSIRRPSVLLVDDDSMLRELLKLILLGDHYGIVGQAGNGQDAVALFERMRPELVLLDINMPRMDGLQALEAIQKIDPNAVVMMVSAEATMDKVTVALSLGAAGFIVKPFNAAGALGSIEKCFRGRGWKWQKS